MWPPEVVWRMPAICPSPCVARALLSSKCTLITDTKVLMNISTRKKDKPGCSRKYAHGKMIESRNILGNVCGVARGVPAACMRVCVWVCQCVREGASECEQLVCGVYPLKRFYFELGSFRVFLQKKSSGKMVNLIM